MVALHTLGDLEVSRAGIPAQRLCGAILVPEHGFIRMYYGSQAKLQRLKEAISEAISLPGFVHIEYMKDMRG